MPVDSLFLFFVIIIDRKLRTIVEQRIEMCVPVFFVFFFFFYSSCTWLQTNNIPNRSINVTLTIIILIVGTHVIKQAHQTRGLRLFFLLRSTAIRIIEKLS